MHRLSSHTSTRESTSRSLFLAYPSFSAYQVSAGPINVKFSSPVLQFSIEPIWNRTRRLSKWKCIQSKDKHWQLSQIVRLLNRRRAKRGYLLPGTDTQLWLDLGAVDLPESEKGESRALLSVIPRRVGGGWEVVGGGSHSKQETRTSHPYFLASSFGQHQVWLLGWWALNIGSSICLVRRSWTEMERDQY